MSTKRVLVSLAEPVLETLDSKAAAEGLSRSGYIAKMVTGVSPKKTAPKKAAADAAPPEREGIGHKANLGEVLRRQAAHEGHTKKTKPSGIVWCLNCNQAV